MTQSHAGQWQTGQDVEANQIGTTKPLNDSDYVPQVGDVVEFEYDGQRCGGVAFKSTSYDEVCVTCLQRGEYCRYDFEGYLKMRKVGHTAIMPHAELEPREAINTAEAYFAQPKTPTFTGSYIERQKQWIEHHGLKVGDKVKIVRIFIENEDGFKGTLFDSSNKEVGKVCEIEDIMQDRIWIYGDCYNPFPYFCLEPVK
jgi:hypothetical protein